jgi:hypothetical protein
MGTGYLLPTDSLAYRNAKQHWVSLQTQRYQQGCIYAPGRDYDADVVKPFIEWLAAQNCCISECRKHETHGVDSYNVAVGADYLEFDTEQDRTFFVLRWA